MKWCRYYRRPSNISRALVGNELVDHSDVGAYLRTIQLTRRSEAGFIILSISAWLYETYHFSFILKHFVIHLIHPYVIGFCNLATNGTLIFQWFIFIPLFCFPVDVIIRKSLFCIFIKAALAKRISEQDLLYLFVDYGNNGYYPNIYQTDKPDAIKTQFLRQNDVVTSF